jgi:hypothetical protein
MRQLLRKPEGNVFDRVVQTLLEAVDEEDFALVKIVGERRDSDGPLKQLSMSWWLSEIVQEVLDNSLRTPTNRVQLKMVCDTLPDRNERSGCSARLYQGLIRRDALTAAR